MLNPLLYLSLFALLTLTACGRAPGSKTSVPEAPITAPIVAPSATPEPEPSATPEPSVAPTPEPSATPEPSPTPEIILPTPTPSATPAPSATPEPSATPAPTPVPTATPVSTPTPAPSPSPTPTPASTCEVRVQFNSIWETGYVVEVFVKNLAEPLSAWSVEFKLPKDHQLVNLWNAEVLSIDKTIQVRNFNYNASVKHQSELNFGMQISGATAKKVFSGETLKLNGNECTRINPKIKVPE